MSDRPVSTGTGPEAWEPTTPVTGLPAPGAGATDPQFGTTGYSTGTDAGSSGPSSTTDVAKGEAGAVKDTAVEAGRNVASTAKDEAANVAQETKQQAQSLIGTVGSELREQAGTQQQRIASAVHSLSKELGGMASSTEESGPLSDLAKQAAARGGEVAHWLENREPADVLEEVKSFGRRRPVAFLGLCLLAGVVVGRLARGAVAANTELDSPDSGNGQGYASLPAGSGSYGYDQPAAVSTGFDDASYGYTPAATPGAVSGTGIGGPAGPGYVEPQGPGYVDPQGTGYVDPLGTPESGGLVPPPAGQPRPDEFR